MSSTPRRSLIILALIAVSVAHSARVLQIVTSVGQWMPATGPSGTAGSLKPTGYWLAEFTHSHDVFKEAGWEIDVASPFGGKGPADPQGFVFYQADPITQKYVAKNSTTNESYVPLTENTLALSAVDASKYDAVFLVGGTGAMFDFPHSVHLHNVVRRMWEAGKVVAAVCHGPVGLANLKLTDGSYLVANKIMTGFSNDEEAVLGRVNVCVFCYLGFEPGCDPATCDGPYMPTEYYLNRTVTANSTLNNATGVPSFLIESQLKLRGAKYVSTFQDWKTFYFRPHVVVDGRLVTGQNPGSSVGVAQALLQQLA